MTMTTKLTERQRQAIECMEAARSEGVALSAYARSRGLEVRELYDAIAALRRKGALPAAAARVKKPFVAVRVAAHPAPASPDTVAVAGRTLLCRVRIGAAAVLECCEWPPAGWLAGLLAERGGDAT